MGVDATSGAVFGGAKVALFLGEKLAVILRDEVPGLPFAGHWDLPGGGREGAESPLACVQRECHEELGLRLSLRDMTWGRAFETGEGVNWFFVARLTADHAERVVFGNEGQCWRLMEPEQYLRHPKGIARFQYRLRIAMEVGSGGLLQESPPLP